MLIQATWSYHWRGLDFRVSKLFGVDHIRGILVESVDNGGSAKRAGIEPGDVITKVEGSAVVNTEIF